MLARLVAREEPPVLLAVAIGLFFLIDQPQGLATIVLDILNILRGFAESIVSFVRALF